MSLKRGFPQILGLWMITHTEHLNAEGDHRSPISLLPVRHPPIPRSLSFRGGVLFHVTLATQRLCSTLHAASILLP